MKKAIYLIFMLFATSAKAQTSITDYSVSGHWTMEGSPYQINTMLVVDYGNTLIIDPGVEVVFEGNYNITVYGTLKAQGTPELPILFHASDTTGWSNLSTSSGAWMGLSFKEISTADSTILDYCKVYDIKGSISVARPMTISNTEIFHCANTSTLFSITIAYGVFTIDGCNVHDNYVPVPILGSLPDYMFYTKSVDLSAGLSTSGQIVIHNSQIHDNSASAILYATYCNLAIQNSKLYNNITNDEGTLELMYEDSVSLIGNKIYNNVSDGLAAVHATNIIMDVINNYICNNRNIAGGCSATEGGGGLHLSTNGVVGVTRYTVRNNIIANNSAPFGAGIYMYHTGAVVANNAIVNNISPYNAGGGITIDDTWNTSVIKNNIFFHNQGPDADTGSSILSEEGGYYYFNNNYIEHDLHSEFLSLGTLNLEGDSTQNIIGSDPMFVSMAAAGDTVSALTANFAVEMGSPCVNAGDSAGVQAYATDYIGNARIEGGRIDIGPYECTNCGVSSVATVNTLNQFNVFPNPASDNISVILPHTGGIVTVSDITGKVVSTIQAKRNVLLLNLCGLPRGAYIINWQQEGHAATAQKIVLN